MAKTPHKRKALSQQVREAIDASGMSRYRVCKETGISQSLMSRFMSGQGGISLESVDRVADLLGLDIVANPRGKRGR